MTRVYGGREGGRVKLRVRQHVGRETRHKRQRQQRDEYKNVTAAVPSNGEKAFPGLSGGVER